LDASGVGGDGGGTGDLAGRSWPPVGLAAEITFYSVYPRLQQKEFYEWQGAHTEILPANGWGAIGWGVLGVVLFFVVAMAVIVPLMILFPSLQ